MIEGAELYTEEKDESGLSAKVRLDIIDGLFLEVFIWESQEAMYTGTKYRGNYAARYVSCPYKIRILDGHKELGPKYGELHLVLDEFGGGIFAHELMHFILDYIDVRELDFVGDDNEAICLLVGNMTADFWSQFYDLYQEQETPNPVNEYRKLAVERDGYRDAYENMKGFAEANGLNTVTYG